MKTFAVLLALSLMMAALVSTSSSCPSDCKSCMPPSCVFGQHKAKDECGCCDICVSVLNKGDPCVLALKDIPPNERCGDGLKCNPDTKKCVDDH